MVPSVLRKDILFFDINQDWFTDADDLIFTMSSVINC